MAFVGPQVAPLPPHRARFLPSLSRAAAVWLSALVLAFGLISLFYLLQTSSIATSGYDVQRLQVEQKQWELKNEQLRLELAKLQSLAWVEARASELGMRRPDRTITVRVADQPDIAVNDDSR